MSLLHDGAFMAHLEQSKVEAKQQVSSMIDAIYAKVMLDLELWLNKHESNEANDSSVHQLEVDHNDATVRPMELMLPNTQYQMLMQQNANSPPSLPPSHLQSHSNDLSIKSEIESDCEENVTENNLPGESPWFWPNCQPIPPEPLQPTHSINLHSSSHSIAKEEIVECDGDKQNDEVEVKSRMIQNVQSAKEIGYLQVNSEFGQDTISNNRISEFDEVSNRLFQNALTNQPREFNQERMHFDDDLEIDQETLDEVKREIEEEQEMKRRENEGEGRDMREENEGEQIDIVQNEAIDTQANIGNSDNGQHNSDGCLVIQQNQNDANNAIEDQIANEFIVKQTQPNNLQPNCHLQCPYCSKSFDRKYNFKEHVRVHTGERPFQCDQCHKSFNQKRKLAQHKLFHQNIKRFHCDQCDKQFVLKCQLDKHLRTHSGEKPYKCRFCEMTFTESGTRKSHEQAKHLHVKPYRCKVCGLTATQLSMIIKHIRVIHFGLPSTIKEQRERNIIDHRDPKEFVEKV